MVHLEPLNPPAWSMATVLAYRTYSTPTTALERPKYVQPGLTPSYTVGGAIGYPAATRSMTTTLLARQPSLPVAAPYWTVPGQPRLLHLQLQPPQLVPAAAQPPAAQEEAKSAEVVPGLAALLEKNGLGGPEMLKRVEDWCKEAGAAFLSEVIANKEDAAQALGLEGEELQRFLALKEPVLKVGGRTTSTLQAGQRPVSTGVIYSNFSMGRTTTSPVTGPELARGAAQVAAAYIPLTAWPRHTAVVRSQVSPVILSRTFTPAVPEQPIAEEPPLTRNERLIEETEGLPGQLDRRFDTRYLRMDDRFRMHGSEEAILRARIPSPAELENPFLKEIEEDRQRKIEIRQEKALSGGQPNLDQVRKELMREHGPTIKANLNRVFDGSIKLKPVAVGPEVQQRFLHSHGTLVGEVIPTYHGSKQENYASICERGLLIPGKGNELSIVNGAAHGRGIYTARVHAPELSRGFCSDPRMLVCGVLDDAAPNLRPQACGRLSVTAASNAIKHVGDAVVVFDQSRVVPLFEASGEQFSQSRWGMLRQAGGGGTVITPQQWTPYAQTSAPVHQTPVGTFAFGKHKVKHVESGQMAWDAPPVFSSDKNYVKVKRDYEKQQWQVQRQQQRAEKAEVQGL